MELPLHIVELDADILVGEVGGEFTVILLVLAELVPHELLAVTLNVPLLVGANVAVVDEPEGVPPPL